MTITIITIAETVSYRERAKEVRTSKQIQKL